VDPSFINALQFDLTEYISCDEEQDGGGGGCLPFDDDTSAFGVFPSHVIFSLVHILSVYLNYIISILDRKF
jgi:hypothetical protein